MVPSFLNCYLERQADTSCDATCNLPLSKILTAAHSSNIQYHLAVVDLLGDLFISFYFAFFIFQVHEHHSCCVDTPELIALRILREADMGHVRLHVPLKCFTFRNLDDTRAVTAQVSPRYRWT